MALAFLFEFPGGRQEQFDQVLEKLQLICSDIVFRQVGLFCNLMTISRFRRASRTL